MNLSYNWLKEYVDINITPEDLASELTLAGLEVEQISYLANASNLVIGEVLEVSDHPDADTLKVTKVDIKDEISQIVCGAPNVAVGQKVIVAKVGANVNGLKIKDANIRGVASSGMICSLSELGVSEKLLSEEQLKGIEVLDNDAVVGNENVLEYLGLDDAIIEIDLTPNRTDCLSMFNLAHEVAAILDQKAKIPNINDNSGGIKTDLVVTSETDKSLQVLGKIIGNVEIRPSVKWMEDVLRANNMQAINNVVDISNIVMLETGQPLHFYDLDKLAKKELIVKSGIKAKYTALDEEEYNISENDLVITSNDDIIGIAGIIGGDDSKIVDNTKSILIEAAHFDLVSIRKSSRDLNINSEASSRFSKGIDPNAPSYALNRAVDLLIEYASASDLEETVVYNKQDLNEKVLETSVKYVDERLGIELSEDEIVEIFDRLNFKPLKNADKIQVSIPTYRLDIKSEVDLSEEVVRIYGVDKLPATLPLVRMSTNLDSDQQRIKASLESLLLGSGTSEIISYSLVSDKHLKYSLMPIGEPVELSNPISIDRKYYRTSLFSSMLDVISYNEARGNDQYALYEIANVYSDDNDSQERLVIALSQNRNKSAWQDLIDVESYFTFKGRIISILSKLGINEQRVRIKENNSDKVNLHPYQSAEVYIDNKLFGLLGKIHPKLEEEYDIKTAIVGEFNLNVIYEAKKSKVKFTQIPRYPGVSRDIALIVEDDLASENLIKTIIKSGRPLVKSAEVFDVYEGSNIEEGHKSVAIRIFYQSLEKTLTDKDVNEVHENIVGSLIKSYNVTYRK